ncbi:GH92 family glycosyl hydrolase [Acidisarcina polymorpha]|nr:GH92 family glycosyl hydrolase [Acidisarcina polymorpha]
MSAFRVSRCAAALLAAILTAPRPADSQIAERTTAASRSQAVDLVNVFTGTSNSRWMQFPGATLPMGMVKISPDNQGNVWDAGYEYTIASVTGFSFLHTLGLATFTVMPLAGPLENYPGQPKLFAGPPDGPFDQMWTAGYRSRIDKKTETGRPGYYAVDLIDAHTRMELTATERTGWMRFTPPADRPTHLIFDFDAPSEERSQLMHFSVHKVAPNEIAGSMTASNKYAGEFTVFFDTRFSRPFATMGSWQNGEYTGIDANYGTEWRRPRTAKSNVTAIDSIRSGGVWVDFNGEANTPVVLKTGISLVGAEQAHSNLAAETDAVGFDFDRISSGASRTWQQLLSRIELEGGTRDEQIELYTSFYRAYTGKALLDDVDGSYRDACGEIQHLSKPGEHLYSSDALWGAQWTLGPLWDLLTPEIASSFNRALLLGATRGGWLPDVTVNMRYAPIMDAQHATAMIVGAWQKDVREGVEPDAAYAAVRKVLTTPGEPYTCGGRYPEGIAGDRHRAAYLKLGYVPEEDGPASSTFEYAFDDACAATLAHSLGKSEDAVLFTKRAANWRNSLSPATLYAQRRRADGSWVEPNDLQHFGTTGGWSGPGFLEGTAWIYSWFVPQDVPALVAAVGTDRFNQRLEEGFDKHYVDLTNEPDLQAPWLFNYSGKPWFTQRYARDVFSRVFDTSPLNGWPGEEDEGQMGAYVVLAGIGLFDMEGGCTDVPKYQISGPAFHKVTLHLGGHDFEIIASSNSARNVYIQSAKLNGVPLKSLEVSHAALASGGRLEMEMGPEPHLSR